MVQSPEVSAFEDKLSFNAVLFEQISSANAGETSSQFSMPQALIDWKVQVPSANPPHNHSKYHARYFGSPGSFDSCAFVQNPVMSKYTKVTGNRCMEHLSLPADYKDPLLAGKTWKNWYLASHDVRVAKPGRHYVVMWASERGVNASVVTAKLELTIGPWSWGGYASDMAQKLAQSQSTTCSCATNAPSWYGQHLDMIGDVPFGLIAKRHPFARCTAPTTGHAAPDVNPQTHAPQDFDHTPPLGHCHASIKSPKIAETSSVEWSGLYKLQAGTYHWDFYAFKKSDGYEYPDATMDVVGVRVPEAAQSTSQSPFGELESAEPIADAHMTAGLAAESNNSGSEVAPGEMVALSGQLSTAQGFRLQLTDPASGNDTMLHHTYRIQVPLTGWYAFFTQHRPAEFMAEHLTTSCGATQACAAGEQPYVFWSASKTYGVSPNQRASFLPLVSAETRAAAPAMVAKSSRGVMNSPLVAIFGLVLLMGTALL